MPNAKGIRINYLCRKECSKCTDSSTEVITNILRANKIMLTYVKCECGNYGRTVVTRFCVVPALNSIDHLSAERKAIQEWNREN
jgi:hypothetical protein